MSRLILEYFCCGRCPPLRRTRNVHGVRNMVYVTGLGMPHTAYPASGCLPKVLEFPVVFPPQSRPEYAPCRHNSSPPRRTCTPRRCSSPPTRHARSEKGPPCEAKPGCCLAASGSVAEAGNSGDDGNPGGFCLQRGYYDVIDRGRHLAPFGARPGYGHGPALRFRLW